MNSKRSGLWVALLLGLLAILFPGVTVAAGLPARPNIILVLTDDQGYG